MIDLKVTLAKTAELIPDPDNVRKHSKRNIDAIKRSIKRFGIRKPIVAKEDTKVVYAGNATLEAALELGIQEIPVAWIPSETSETVCRAYAIADNRTSELADWNTEQLEKVIAELKEWKIEDVGFTNEELDIFFLHNNNELDKILKVFAGKEIDEAIANDVKRITCPKCGHEFVA